MGKRYYSYFIKILIFLYKQVNGEKVNGQVIGGINLKNGLHIGENNYKQNQKKMEHFGYQLKILWNILINYVYQK